VHPTPFLDLNGVLDELVKGAQANLGENLVGAYLQGSFAVGDADVHSDVDFIVVTNDEVTAEQEAALQEVHRRLFALDVPWAQHLEGSYVTRELLRRVDP
jgi:predicted nucleotidyltransferase